MSIRPMHLFGHNCDHDYYCGLPRKGEWDAQSISRCSTAHHSDVRAVPRTNRTSSIARSPIPCATSSTSERPAYVPRSAENHPSAGVSEYAEHPRDRSSACALVSLGSPPHLPSTTPFPTLPAAAQTTALARWPPCQHVPSYPQRPTNDRTPLLPGRVLNAFLGTLRCRYLPKQFLDTRGENRLL